MIIKIDVFERKLLVQALDLHLNATYEASRGDLIVGASLIDTINDLSKRLQGAEEVGVRRRGRPKAQGERPWEAAGMSRATWYRRKADEEAK